MRFGGRGVECENCRMSISGYAGSSELTIHGIPRTFVLSTDGKGHRVRRTVRGRPEALMVGQVVSVGCNHPVKVV